MAWNADGTRMPYRMHSEYLEQFFLNNDLSEGRYRVDDRTVSIGDIRAPTFVVATETDHVAPWRSVYKFQMFFEGDLTFVLASGGHNAGIVSPPGRPHRAYRLERRAPNARHVDPERWREQTERRPGSRWTPWLEWLGAQPGEMAPPPPLGAPDAAPLTDAPGTYVRME
jgi:polyhydroxyalkanoate synthase